MVFQQNAGGLRARSSELLHFFCLILLTLFVCRNPVFTHFLFFQIPGFSTLRSDHTHSLSGIVISRTLVAALSFLSGRVYPFLNFLPSLSLSSLDLYSDYVGVNISLNNSSLLTFLNVHALPICSSPSDGKTDSYSPSISSSTRDLFILGYFNSHHPPGTQELLPTTKGESF